MRDFSLVEWSFERKLALALMLSAIDVALSPINIPIGPTRASPWQHMTNVISGVILGPLWASAIAILVGTVRIILGIGTVFAYPGGIPGGLLVGIGALILRKAKKKTEYAAFLEPIGTAVIGFLLSLYLVAPIVGKYNAWISSLVPIWIIWILSTGIGTTIGFAAIKILRGAGVLK
ncbi:MAG: energy coupling factor transporter S component ThiW [Fervidicoccaceae archaeon]